MWIMETDGTKVFKPGRSDWATAAREAEQCDRFRPDDEDEWVADEPRSCYNCRYRRWTVRSVACMKG